MIERSAVHLREQRREIAARETGAGNLERGRLHQIAPAAFGDVGADHEEATFAAEFEHVRTH